MLIGNEEEKSVSAAQCYLGALHASGKRIMADLPPRLLALFDDGVPANRIAINGSLFSTPPYAVAYNVWIEWSSYAFPTFRPAPPP